jgi:hypothetical protein
MKRILPWVIIATVLVPASSALARPQAQRQRPAPKAEPVKAPDPVDIRATFGLTTPSEQWALEDPMPERSVKFGDKQISIDERMVNVSASSDGQRQYLFPVSWFEPYQSTNPDIKYVVVKYKNGRACSIMAEYLPNRLALPKAEFQAHPDGKTYYSDVAIVRHEGHLYLKQAISQGKDDGRGGLWVDMMVMYCTEDKSAVSKPDNKSADAKASVRRP